MGLRLVPVMPAFGADMAVHVAVDQHCPGIFSPGPSEIDRAGRTLAGEAAPLHDVTVGLALGSGGGGDIAVDRAADIF